MMRACVRYIASIAMGALTSVALWIVFVAVLFAAGLSFYAVNSALPVSLLAMLISAPLLYRAGTRRIPHHHGPLLAFLIAGAAFPLYGTVAVALTAPHTILFLS